MYGFVIRLIDYALPIMFAATGGLLSERAGVVNFALEGMILSGAFAAFAASRASGSAAVGLIFGLLAGLACGAVHALASVRFRINHIVSSLAVNLFALGMTNYLYGTLSGGAGPLSDDRAVMLSPYFRILFLTVIAGTILVLRRFLKSNRGLLLRSCGEDPSAALSMGVPVGRMRFGAVLASGLLGGLAGSYLMLVDVGIFAKGMSDGRGYLAVAAVILGRWKPAYVCLAVLCFALGVTASDYLQLHFQGLSAELCQAVPFALVVLVAAASPRARYIPSGLGRSPAID